jgi:hypothetical protein
MSATQLPDVLDYDDLRTVDKWLLEYLKEGRVTPVYCKQRIQREHGKEYTGTYLQQRLARFVDHDHARNLYNTGLYELVDEPQ